MVLGREGFATAAQRVAEEAAMQFARDAEFFARFERRFSCFSPATLDHFFAASPEESCVAAGWDYWQLTERAGDEAEKVYEHGLTETELLLRAAREEGLPCLLVGVCGRTHHGN
jgi:hypothetical protein